MSLKSQIENLQPGESFITDKTRTGIYVAAKRADVEISTEIVDGGIKVTRKTTYQKMVEAISLVDRIAALPTKDRLELFERFELCCGMNRGECVCETGLDIMDSLAGLGALREMMANPQSSIILPPPTEGQTHWEVREGHSPNSEPVVLDAWHGWSDELTTPDRETGEIVTYREHLKTRKRKEIRRESSMESA